VQVAAFAGSVQDAALYTSTVNVPQLPSLAKTAYESPTPLLNPISPVLPRPVHFAAAKLHIWVRSKDGTSVKPVETWATRLTEAGAGEIFRIVAFVPIAQGLIETVVMALHVSPVKVPPALISIGFWQELGPPDAPEDDVPDDEVPEDDVPDDEPSTWQPVSQTTSTTM
jgi:hypothetical protein